MAYLSEEQLRGMGFKHLGRKVLISQKASVYNADRMSIGDHSRIDDFCVLSGRIEIGRNVHIAALNLIAGGEPGVFFEDFSGTAYNVSVFAQSDDYLGKTLTNPTVPAKFKAEIKKAVFFRRYVIAGAGAVIMPGVTLGEGTSVGALALVTRSTEPWGIYGGVPAKRIGEREQGLVALAEEYLRAEREG